MNSKWRVVVFLTVAVALNYADRAALSVVLPSVKADLGLSDVELGVLSSMFLWSYALASPFAGMLADRYSRTAMVLISLAAWSIVTGITGFVNGFAMLLVARIALGLAESLYLPASVALIADHHGNETRGRAMSSHYVGVNAGVVLGGTFTGFLAEAYGWRSGFWVLGVVGVLVAMAGKAVLIDGPQRSTNERHGAAVNDAIKYLSRTPSYLILLTAAMMAGVALWIFFGWLPLYFQEAFNLTMGAAGFAGTFMLQIFSALGIIVGGWLSDRAARRSPTRRLLVFACAYVAAAPFLLVFVTHPSLVIVSVAIALFSFARGIGDVNGQPVLCDVVPPAFRSTAVGIMNTCATAAGGLGIIVAGFLKRDVGLETVFAGCSCVFVVASIALALGYRVCARRDIVRAAALGAEPAGGSLVASRAETRSSSS